MNFAPINAEPFIGFATQAQRLVVSASASVELAGGGRVWRFVKRAHDAAAQSVVRAKKEVRNAEEDTVLAVAVIGSTRNARSPLADYGVAFGAYTSRIWVRSPLYEFSVAWPTYTRRVFVRSKPSANGAAASTIAAKRGARSPLTGESTVSQTGSLGTTRRQKDIRVFVVGAGQAAGVVFLRSLVRSVFAGDGRAVAQITSGVVNEFAYDEDAPLERSFVVPEANNLFVVV